MSINITATIGGDTVAIVYPFSFNNLKDEALDEAQITFYSSTKKEYPPNTPVAITFGDKTNTYVVASDNATELPIGSGKYKHSMGLIEETKILEGIICPSLTFTNSRGHAIDAVSYLATVRENVSIISVFEFPTTFTTTDIKSPIPSGKAISFPSASDLGTQIFNYIQNNTSNATFSNLTIYDKYPVDSSDPTYTSKCDVVLNDTTIATYLKDQAPIITPSKSGTYELNYDIIYEFDITNSGITSEHSGVWKITFNVDALNEKNAKPWSITECVSRVLECSEPIFFGENPRYTFDGITYTEGVASAAAEGSQAEKYSTVLAPEFTMTKCTLREQLKVIGSFIHAEPRLTDGIISFEEYGVGTDAAISKSKRPYVRNAPSIDINNYITDIYSSTSNIVSNSDSDVAIIQQFSRAVSSVNVNERVTEANAVLTTDKAIHTIHKVLVDIRTDSGTFIENADITPYILEATEYQTLASNYVGGTVFSKSIAAYYTIGQPNLNGLFYIAPAVTPSQKYYSISRILSVTNKNSKTLAEIQNALQADITRLRIKIIYTPYYNAEITHGKGEMSDNPTNTRVYNQSENQVDTQYIGEAIKAVAARLGNAEEERTYYLAESELGLIPTTSETIDGLYISSVACEVMPYSVKCTVNLTKDLQRINQFVGINSIKRMWEVSEREVYDRDIIIKEILAVSLDDPITLEKGGVTVHSIESIERTFTNAINDETGYFINYASAITRQQDLSILYERNYPAITSSFGNTTHCSLFAKDNYSCGVMLSKGVDAETGVEGYWTKDVPYADYWGRAYWMSFKYGYGSYQFSKQGELGYPIASINTPGDYVHPIYLAREHSLRLRKDSRERITLTCQLEAKSLTKNLVIGSALSELNEMVYKGVEALSLVLVRFTEDINLDKFANTLDMIPSTAYEMIQLTSSNTEISYEDDDNLLLKVTLDDNAYNLGHGFALATSISENTEDVINDNGEEVSYTSKRGGKILLLRTASREERGTLKLYFKILRKQRS